MTIGSFNFKYNTENKDTGVNMKSGNGDIKQHHRLAMGEKLDGQHARGGKIGPDKEVESADKRNPRDKDLMDLEKESGGEGPEIDNFKRGGGMKKGIAVSIRPVSIKRADGGRVMEGKEPEHGEEADLETPSSEESELHVDKSTERGVQKMVHLANGDALGGAHDCGVDPY